MIRSIEKVLEKFMELSQDGYLTVSYENSVMSIDFHATEKFELEIRDNDDTYRLYYIADNRAVPCEIRFKKCDIKSATYYAEGEFKECPFTPVIVLTFNDGSSLHAFEDVR